MYYKPPARTPIRASNPVAAIKNHRPAPGAGPITRAGVTRLHALTRSLPDRLSPHDLRRTAIDRDEVRPRAGEHGAGSRQLPALRGGISRHSVSSSLNKVERREIMLRVSRLSFAFSSLLVNQHNVAGFSPAFGDNHLAVGRPGETENRLGRKIRQLLWRATVQRLQPDIRYAVAVIDKA